MPEIANTEAVVQEYGRMKQMEGAKVLELRFGVTLAFVGSRRETGVITRG